MLTWNTSDTRRAVDMLLDATAEYARLCQQLDLCGDVDPDLCLTVEPRTGKRYWTQRK